MAQERHWLITVGLVTSLVITVVANALLLLLFCRRRSLRNRFVINLLLTNLLSSVLLIPFLVADQEVDVEIVRNSSVVITEEITDENVDIIIQENVTETITADRSRFLCRLAQSTTSLVCAASILSILLIGIDQYFAVIHSLRYHSYINRCRSWLLIAGTWFVAVLFSVCSAASGSQLNSWHFCRKEPSDGFSAAFAFVYFLVVIVSPFAAICIIYVCIYAAAHNNSERMRRSTSGNSNTNLTQVYMQVPMDAAAKPPSLNSLTKIENLGKLPTIKSAPNLTNLDEYKLKNPKHNFMVTLKYKISNASAFRYREEIRAAKISLLVIFMVLFCYVPYGLMLILNSHIVNISVPEYVNYCSVISIAISNILSPFLFAYRNRRVQRELLRLFGLIPMNSDANRLSGIGRKPSVLPDHIVPEVVVCKVEGEKKSILKRVYSKTSWTNYKKCNFISVPDSCLSADARGSFSSTSTQVSCEE